MGVDLAHGAVSNPAERWRWWHKIACAISNDDSALAKELCIANTASTRRNLYWDAHGCAHSRAVEDRRSAKAGECHRDRAGKRRRAAALSPRSAARGNGWEGYQKGWKEEKS